MGMGPERTVVIVLETRLRRARMQQQPIEAGCGEFALGILDPASDVVAIQPLVRGGPGLRGHCGILIR